MPAKETFIPLYPPPSLKLLSCSPTRMAEFCAFILPRIWAGSFHQSQAKRTAAVLQHVSLKAYFRSFFKRFKATSNPDIIRLDPVCVLLAFEYIHRFRTLHPNARGHQGAEVRLFVSAFILAHKYHPDRIFSVLSEMKFWSQISGIPTKSLTLSERVFLKALDHKMDITRPEFMKWTIQCQHWVSLLAKKKGWSPVHISAKELSESSTLGKQPELLDYHEEEHPHDDQSIPLWSKHFKV